MVEYIDEYNNNIFMNSLLGLIIQIINLYQFILLIYIIATWLLNFNIINSSNRFVYTAMEALYRLCEPSLKFVRRYIPNFGTVDISPIVVYLGLWFIKSLIIEYWPR
tara:strand:+ start:158 stop:478 length:321 start_codon:yes stop_codon:yes gene_type:complete